MKPDVLQFTKLQRVGHDLAADQQQLLVTSPMVFHPYQGILTTAKKAICF